MGRRHLPLRTRRPGRDRRGAAQRRRLGGRGGRTRARPTWPTPATTACSSTAPKGRCSRSGAPAAGTGHPEAKPGEFNHPAAVAVGPQGQIYVADKGNDRIVELSAGGSVLTQWGSRGTTDGRFHAPTGVAVDGGGTCVRGRQRKQPRRGVRLRRAASSRSGACAAPDWASSPSRPRSRWTAPATCTWPTRTTTESSASTPSPPPHRLPGAGRLAAAAGRRAGAAREPAAARGVLARRALALTVSCQRGCKVLVTATLSPRGPGGAP